MAEFLPVAMGKCQPDIIAPGAKDRTGIESCLYGNVAEKVARHIGLVTPAKG